MLIPVPGQDAARMEQRALLTVVSLAETGGRGECIKKARMAGLVSLQ